ncbi:leucine-rich repeat domain-containing protein [Butyrivibrio sp. AE2032]|uniref:leucine-rich repeat domain-containing protein n=1 Tax=Butyrivibrio sp. AE2032 TaxID=1458463 RepID=UPI000690AAD1|nr:leucine-rich repeat domain-containing protein [Butyrivibrio sp. AE2032]
MPVIPLECPSCGADLRIDSDESATICIHCGKPFVVKDAIVENYIKLVTEIKGDISTLEDFETEDGILKRYNGASACAVIPDDVTAIGIKAFEDCRWIREVRFPDSVTEIGENAFSGCVNLQSMIFNSSLRKIGSYAFSECTALKSVELPVNLEDVGQYAFSGCFMLESVKMPSSKTKVHETVFMGDRDLVFDWPADWKNKQWDKLRIAAPALGGLACLCDQETAPDSITKPLLFLGISEPDMKYNFYTYHGFMNLFSIGKNNDDPYLLRLSVEYAQQRYDAISDIQKSYSELISLLDLADISRDIIQPINIPHFIWKQGKRIKDYKLTDIGPVSVLQFSLRQE